LIWITILKNHVKPPPHTNALKTKVLTPGRPSPNANSPKPAKKSACIRWRFGVISEREAAHRQPCAHHFSHFLSHFLKQAALRKPVIL
jgi:hypothetical protein